MKKMNKRQTLEWIRDKILGGHLDEDISRGDIVNAIDDALERHDMNMWAYYQKHVRNDALGCFALDAIEFHENVKWVMEKLEKEKPTPGTSHDWNGAIDALKQDYPKFKKAYLAFRKSVNEKNAQKFSDAFDEIYPSFRMANDSMFCSMLRGHWNKVKDELKEKENDRKRDKRSF